MTASVAGAGARAGFVTRLAAMIVDVLLISVAVRSTMWLLEVAAHFVRRPAHWSHWISLPTLIIALAPPFKALYHLIGWRLRGQTIGKWLLGIRVVSLGGGPLTLGQSFSRVVGYFLSALPLDLGFLWILGPERRGFHDYFAKTEVIYTRPPPVRTAPTTGRLSAA
jgi:uncharacterized RDD family membrane protein YckC